MNPSAELFLSLAERLGWALLHSLWQGVLVAAVLAVVLLVLGPRRAAARHATCLLALLAMLAAVGTTFWQVNPPPPHAIPASATAGQSARVVVDEARSASHKERRFGIADPLNARSASLKMGASRLGKFGDGKSPLLEDAHPWLAGGWMLGVLLLSLRQLGGWRRVRALRQGGTIARPEWQQPFAQLAARFGQRKARLLESAAATGPMLAGLFKPVVLLPARVATGLSAPELEAIFAHELAHLTRRDAWSNFAQIVVETLFFYHPAVWWIGHRARVEREHAADDLALRVCADHRVYAGALAHLAEIQFAPERVLAATGGDLLARIRRIVRPAELAPAASGWSLGLPAALTLAVLAGIFAAQAQDEQATPRVPASPAAADTRAPSGGFVEVKPNLGLGFTIDLNLAPHLLEFEGFIHYGSPIQVASTNALGQSVVNVMTPNVINQPIFSTRKVITGVSISDEQTIVLGGLVREDVRAAAPPSAGDQPAATPAPEKAEIEVEWKGRWWPARVLEKAGDKTLIHYIGYGKEWEEWVSPERVRPLSAQGAALEKSVESRSAKLVEQNRQAARLRAAEDRRNYTPEQLQEIETLYQVANTKGKRSVEAKASLKQVLEKYDRANRTGCATLYLGQASEGAERLEYLTRAVEKFSDCYYFNGCQVGGYGRYVLALTLWEKGEKEKARALLAELKTTYKDATDHRGRPMSEVAEAVEKELAAQETR